MEQTKIDTLIAELAKQEKYFNLIQKLSHLTCDKLANQEEIDKAVINLKSDFSKDIHKENGEIDDEDKDYIHQKVDDLVASLCSQNDQIKVVDKNLKDFDNISNIEPRVPTKLKVWMITLFILGIVGGIIMMNHIKSLKQFKNYIYEKDMIILSREMGKLFTQILATIDNLNVSFSYPNPDLQQTISNQIEHINTVLNKRELAFFNIKIS